MTAGQKKLLFWGALLVLGAYFFGQCQPQSDDAELNRLVALNLANVRQARTALSAQKLVSEALGRQLVRERSIRLAAARQADSAHSTADSLESRLGVLLTAADSVLALTGVVGALRGEATALRLVIGSLERTVDSLESDRQAWRRLAERAGVVNDSLAAALERVNEARKCRVVFLPCPSRITVGLVSLVAGTVVGVLVR